MKSLNDAIAQAANVFCENARLIVSRRKHYEECGCEELVNDIMLIEGQLQEIDEMLKEFGELKALGLVSLSKPVQTMSL